MDKRNGPGGPPAARDASNEKLYVLLCRISEQVREADLQIRALNRRLDLLQNGKKGD